MVIMILSFVFSIMGSVSSYFKSMSDIRQEIQSAIFHQAIELRKEIRDQYATKEEFMNQKEILSEIKSDLKDIKRKLDERK